MNIYSDIYMYIFKNVPYFSLEITIACRLMLYLRYRCYILCHRRRQPATTLTPNLSILNMVRRIIKQTFRRYQKILRVNQFFSEREHQEFLLCPHCKFSDFLPKKIANLFDYRVSQPVYSVRRTSSNLFEAAIQ